MTRRPDASRRKDTAAFAEFPVRFRSAAGLPAGTLVMLSERPDFQLAVLELQAQTEQVCRPNRATIQ